MEVPPWEIHLPRLLQIYLNDSKTIHIESSQVLIDPQDKLKHKTEAFQDYYMLFFTGGSTSASFVRGCVATGQEN